MHKGLPKIDEALPPAQSLRDRLSRNLTDEDRNMRLGPDCAASARFVKGHAGKKDPAGDKDA